MRRGFEGALRRVTGGKGADVIYDPVGGRTPNQRCVRLPGWAFL